MLRHGRHDHTPHQSLVGGRINRPLQSQLRRWAPVAILLALILGFGVWALRLPNKQAEHAVSIISDYVASPDSRTVGLSVAAGCTENRVVTAHVDESPSTIRVAVRAKNDYTPPGEAAKRVHPHR